jgi:hypothetical protein
MKRKWISRRQLGICGILIGLLAPMSFSYSKNSSAQFSAESLALKKFNCRSQYGDYLLGFEEKEVQGKPGLQMIRINDADGERFVFEGPLDGSEFFAPDQDGNLLTGSFLKIKNGFRFLYRGILPGLGQIYILHKYINKDGGQGLIHYTKGITEYLGEFEYSNECSPAN